MGTKKLIEHSGEGLDQWPISATTMTSNVRTWKAGFRSKETVEAQPITGKRALTKAEALSWMIWAMCEAMDGARQVTPVGGLSDFDCRLSFADNVTLPVAETGPEEALL